MIFTGRQHSSAMQLQALYYTSGCLFVRPSVTRWYYAKTTQARIMKSSPTDSARTRFRDKKVQPEIRKGSPRAMALNETGVGKIRNFQPITRRISETVQDGTKVTINH